MRFFEGRSVASLSGRSKRTNQGLGILMNGDGLASVWSCSRPFLWCGGDYGGFLGWRSPHPAIFDALQTASAVPSLVALQDLFGGTFRSFRAVIRSWGWLMWTVRRGSAFWEPNRARWRVPQEVFCVSTQRQGWPLKPLRASLLIPSPVATKTQGMPFHHSHLTEYTQIKRLQRD